MQRAAGRRRGERTASDEQLDLAAIAGRDLTAITAAPTSFEIVNAAYGRQTGDQLVDAIDDRLSGALIEFRSAAVRSGATFTIVVAGDAQVGDAAVDAVERALEHPFAIGAETILLGARIGVARMSGDEPLEHLLRRAAEALAHARSSEGATTRIAADGTGVPLAALAADLHRAIERHEIDVRFQPQVNLIDGRIVGVEALARWHHPRLGEVGAETLLAAADRAGLGVALSDHVQALALRRAVEWPDALSRMRVAVNVTATDLSRTPFVSRFLARVHEAGIAPGRVTAEVTEGAMIDNLHAAGTALAALRAAGCRVALDDFGTGYSSLSYVATLPLDYLKIDRSLTQSAVGDARNRVVLQGVLGIAEGLGLETVAEGVETDAQRLMLAARGCTLYQGFLCAGPLDDAGLIELVRAADAKGEQAWR
ncbi:GGDEF domain-containing phosphodiesterase [uncultured Sphingomonas sp.]|uniref:GGDEF domain-containing phosphodiesterase n=1 Tax=uncultured Sphingomonas sp. TaxID=158754 RepID=UPI0025CC462D|nr:GGDEF domain-containing phosphodiesterase [uncultured Sphingomonas sp.]